MKHPDRISGVVTDDPAALLGIGSTIKIEPILVRYADSQTPAWLQDWTSFQGVLLSICVRDAVSNRICGSAVMVAPGIAIGARHVIDPALPGLRKGAQMVYCFGLTPSGLRIWVLRKYTAVTDTDLAILGLELASPFASGDSLFLTASTTRLPSVGEDLLLCGFRSAETAYSDETTTYGGQVLVSRGTVTKPYLCGRDTVMMPWPCLEVYCPTWGGMSGGPVYDAKGHLVGILSSSVEAADDMGPSFVSLIWPALATAFEGGWPAPLFPSATTLLGLDPRLCVIERRDAIQLISHPDTGVITKKYRPWEQPP